MTPSTGVCDACRRPLPPLKRAGNPRRWCDDACRVWALRHPGETRETDPRCGVCQRPIAGRPSHAKYCSHACALAAQGRLGSDRADRLAAIAAARRASADRPITDEE